MSGTNHWAGYLPEIKGAYKAILAIEQFLHDDAHDWIIITTTQWRIWMRNYRTSSCIWMCSLVVVQAIVDSTIQDRVIVKRRKREIQLRLHRRADDQRKDFQGRSASSAQPSMRDREDAAVLGACAML